MVSPDVKEQFQMEPSHFLEEEIKTLVRTSLLNRMPESDNIIFDEPPVQFADGDNPIFTEYKTITGSTHLTPGKVLAKYFSKTP